MEPDDPFSRMMKELCKVSASEESSFPYFGQPNSDDSNSNSQNASDIPVASTGITMVSPPESPEDELLNDTNILPEDQEIFHTPPESRSTSTSFDNCTDFNTIGDDLDNDGETDMVGADSADSRRAVELGRNTDLGSSEVEVDSTQRIEVNSTSNDAFGRELEEIRVSKGGFSPKRQLSTEPPPKILKSLDFESPSVRLGSPKERSTDEILKSLERWKLKIDMDSPRASSELELENQQNHESKAGVGEGSGRKRRLDFSTEVIDFENEERNMESENNNGEGSSKEKSADFSTEYIECDTEERKVESENDNGEGNSGIKKKSVDSSTEVGKGSVRKIRVDFSTEVINSENEERNMESANNREGSSRRKSADFSTEGERKVESENNNGEGNSGRNKKSLEDTDQFRYGGNGSNSRGMEEKTERKRSLPSWANGRVEVNERESVKVQPDSRANGRVRPDERVEVNEREAAQVQDDKDSDSWGEDFEEITLLDLLKELEEECEEDRDLECLSLLEVAEEKGLMFPRPTSSPQE